MDRNDCKVIRTELQQVLDKHMNGLTVKVLGAAYDNMQATFRVQIQREGAEAPEVHAFRQVTEWSSVDGLKAEDLGKEFTDSRGTRFTVIGYRPKAKIRPILCKDVVSGREYVFAAKDVARLLNGR
jgi:hypothetical protein